MPLSRTALVTVSGVLGAGYAVYSVDRYAFTFLTPTVASNLTIPIATVGLLGTIFLWGQIAASLPASLFMVRHGFRPTLIVGLAVTTIGVFATGLTSDTITIGVARIVTGIGEGFWNVAIVLAFVGVFSNRKGFGAGLSQTFFGVGILGGPILAGSILALTGNWRDVFYALSALGFVVCILISVLTKQGQLDEPSFTEGQRTTMRAVLQAIGKELRKSRSATLTLIVGFTLFEIAFWSYAVLVSTYLETGLGLNPATAAFFAGADGIAIVFLGWWAGSVGDLTGRGRAIAMGGAVQGVTGVLIFSIGSNEVALFALALVFGVSLIICYSSIFAAIASQFQPETARFMAGLVISLGLIPAGYIGYAGFAVRGWFGWSATAGLLIGLPSFAMALIALALPPQEVAGGIERVDG